MLACVEAGDLSPLMPLSVRDLIWVRVAQLVRRREALEGDAAKTKADFAVSRDIYLLLADLRSILIGSNFFGGISAFKENPKLLKELKPIDIDSLPSGIAAAKAEEERRSKLSPEEQREERIKDFLAGKKYVPQ